MLLDLFNEQRIRDVYSRESYVEIYLIIKYTEVLISILIY